MALETPRLRLRRMTEHDAPFVLELLNQPSFLRYIGDKGVRTLEDARAYVRSGPAASYERHGFGLYIVELKDGEPPGGSGAQPRSGESPRAPSDGIQSRREPPEGSDGQAPIGMSGLLRRDYLDAPDLGFAFLPQAWSRGYARESAEAVMVEGRERFGLRRVLAITTPDNAPSIGLLARLGFRFERTAQPDPGQGPLNVYARED